LLAKPLLVPAKPLLVLATGSQCGGQPKASELRGITKASVACAIRWGMEKAWELA
jgi:hypothetical protein